MSIAKDNPDIRKATRSIFLDIDNETMRRRIENRAKLTGTIVPEEEIARRISAAENERKLAQEYCTVIVNGTGTIEEETDRAEKIIIQFLEKSHINPISQST